MNGGVIFVNGVPDGVQWCSCAFANKVNHDMARDDILFWPSFGCQSAARNLIVCCDDFVNSPEFLAECTIDGQIAFFQGIGLPLKLQKLFEFFYACLGSFNFGVDFGFFHGDGGVGLFEWNWLAIFSKPSDECWSSIC